MNELTFHCIAKERKEQVERVDEKITGWLMQKKTGFCTSHRNSIQHIIRVTLVY